MALVSYCDLYGNCWEFEDRSTSKNLKGLNNAQNVLKRYLHQPNALWIFSKYTGKIRQVYDQISTKVIVKI